jgi:hypothetical protein
MWMTHTETGFLFFWKSVIGGHDENQVAFSISDCFANRLRESCANAVARASNHRGSNRDINTDSDRDGFAHKRPASIANIHVNTNGNPLRDADRTGEQTLFLRVRD